MGADNKWLRQAAAASLIGLLVTLPLPLYRPLWPRPFPGVAAELTSFNLYPADVFLLVFLLTAVFHPTLPSSAAVPRSVTQPLAMLVGLTAVSSLWAFDAALAGQQALRLLLLLVLFWALARTRPAQRGIQIGMAAAVLLQAGVALLQFARQDDLGLRRLGELDLMTAAGGDSILFAAGQYWLRGYGLTPHPNILGGVLALFTLALIIPYLQAQPRAKPFWLAVILCGLAGLFITFSRAAWLGGAVGGLFLLAGLLGKGEWRAAYGRSLLILLCGAGLLLGALGWQQRHLLASRAAPAGSSLESRAVNERAALAAAGGELFRLAPLTGIGAGNTAVALIPAVAGAPRVGPQPVHNVPLLLAIELGLPGATLWLWLMLFPIGLGWRRRRENRLTLWAWGITAALLAFAVIDLFDYYAWGWQQGRLLRWLFLGLWAAAVAVNPPQSTAGG